MTYSTLIIRATRGGPEAFLYVYTRPEGKNEEEFGEELKQWHESGKDFSVHPSHVGFAFFSRKMKKSKFSYDKSIRVPIPEGKTSLDVSRSLYFVFHSINEKVFDGKPKYGSFSLTEAGILATMLIDNDESGDGTIPIERGQYILYAKPKEETEEEKEKAASTKNESDAQASSEK